MPKRSGYFLSPSLRDYPARTRAFSIDEILNAVANEDDVDVSEYAKFRSQSLYMVLFCDRFTVWIYFAAFQPTPTERITEKTALGGKTVIE